MAEFCHEYDPGGLGCPHPGPCPENCLGDFNEPAQEAVKMLSAGYEVTLGVCEGCGTVVTAIMDDRGDVWVEHKKDDETIRIMVIK